MNRAGDGVRGPRLACWPDEPTTALDGPRPRGPGSPRGAVGGYARETPAMAVLHSCPNDFRRHLRRWCEIRVVVMYAGSMSWKTGADRSALNRQCSPATRTRVRILESVPQLGVRGGRRTRRPGIAGRWPQRSLTEGAAGACVFKPRWGRYGARQAARRSSMGASSRWSEGHETACPVRPFGPARQRRRPAPRGGSTGS